MPRKRKEKNENIEKQQIVHSFDAGMLMFGFDEFAGARKGIANGKRRLPMEGSQIPHNSLGTGILSSD